MWQFVSAFFNSFFKPRAEFQDLPLEILSKIASYLSFVDVLSYRQTSRRLRDATESRSVWAALAAEYCTRHLDYPRPRTTMSLGTEELRKWVMERCIIDEIWKKPVVRPRSVNLSRHGKCFAVAIIPGGRWALLGNYLGFIHAYDLYHEDPQPSLLIAPQRTVAGASQAVDAIIVSVDSESPGLQFTIAFTGKGPDFVSWIHIWQVRLGPDDRLLAQKLLSMPCFPRYRPSLSLSNDLVARAFTPATYSETWAEVFWWKECSDTYITKSTIRMKCKPEFIQIIGNDRLFCADFRKGIYIYDIPEPDTAQYERPPKRLFLEDSPIRDPVWFHPLGDGYNWGYSRLYFDGAQYRQVISTDSGIYGLVVPASKEEPLFLLKLANMVFNAVPVYGLGLYKGYAALEGGGVRFGYSWGKGMPDTPTYHNGGDGKLIPFERWPYVAFDEETGRFIGISPQYATLVDFIPDQHTMLMK